MLTLANRPAPHSTLNASQLAAVQHGILASGLAGPLLVIAGAGTGKTFTMASRVARLIFDGADPQRILMMTFSRRAAAAMSHRVGRLLHETLRLGATTAPPALPWSGTFHSVAARLLRLHARAIGLAEDFTVLDRADSEELLALVRHGLGLGDSRERFPLGHTCLAIHSRVLNACSALAPLLKQDFPWCEPFHDELKNLFRAYAAEKQRQHLLDYDDLLVYWQMALAEPTLAQAMQRRFEHVLVDEYQDTNPLQARIVRALKPDGRGLMVVGDDAQCIYGFRGADVRGILDFSASFNPPAQVLALEQNYRSTAPILAASNAVIGLASERLNKTLWCDRPSSAKPRLVSVLDEAAQARWVADEVLRQREQGLVLKRQAVLFRTSHHSAALELELTRRHIPFVKFGGLRFLEAVHIKDVLSLLRWASNPRCRLAAHRVARLVPGIGVASARQFAEQMTAADDPLAALQDFVPPTRARDEWSALVCTYSALASADAPWPAAIEHAVRWYVPHLRRLHDHAAVRELDLQQLCRMAAGSSSLERFITELTLDPPESTSDESGPPLRDEDYLILSTLHSAKGQEWNAVYLLNMVDGCMPSDLATGNASEIEEERRLLYVGMTRARDELVLMQPQGFHVTQQRHHGDRHMFAARTRFIPAQLLELFECVEPEAKAGDGCVAEGSGLLVDIRKQALGLWE